MDILHLYLIGVGVAAVFGVLIGLLLKSGLASLLKTMFPEAAVQKFWSRLVYTVVMLASLSGAMSAVYPDEAKTDRLIRIWSFMNQTEAMGFRLLWTLLVILSVFLLAYSFRKRDT
ncbi:MAG: hypothetical protein JW765_11275 [Deltaproteobacteria bacterium]|nr:hypothetical protein [Candidatus Zymogenaceae bacterium]